MIELILAPIEFVISAIGLTIVVWGVMRSLHVLLPLLLHKADLQLEQYRKVRIMLAQYILLGLEFLVASDVIYTIRAHDQQSLVLLVVLVVLRVLLSYSLDREIRWEQN